jgi:pimeloyl-ACP methyl ester carboxylesterase
MVSTFILIHGGWHAAWCWDRVLALLEKAGHCVIAPDLPGHGADPTPLSAKPYAMYVPRVCALLDTIEDRAIVVGHSSGGMIITEACRRRNERIKALVYLSAFLLPSSKTPRDVIKMDSESLLPACLEIDSSRAVTFVRQECARDVFYGDCTEQDAAWAISQLQPEPLIPEGAVAIDGGFGELSDRPPRFYIECLEDRALGPNMQRWMYTESQCSGVYSLSTSHSPFLSAPEMLVQHLIDINESIS